MSEEFIKDHADLIRRQTDALESIAIALSELLHFLHARNM